MKPLLALLLVCHGGLFAVAQEIREEDAVRSSVALGLWLDQRAQAGTAAGAVCDDSTFLRRVSLDLRGRIPSVAETHDFLLDTTTDKRSRLVDDLLIDADDTRRNRGSYSTHVARLWRRIILPPGMQNAAQFGPSLEQWLESQFVENTPYHVWVRRLLTDQVAPPTEEMTNRPLTRGAMNLPSPAVFYQAVGGQPENYADHVTRIFLGTRIGCAQCHDHPFAQWKKGDFWGMAAFFAGTKVGFGPAGLTLTEEPVATLQSEGVTYSAKLLGGAAVTLTEGQLPRTALADWLVSGDNPLFAANGVNRLWQQLCGRGLIADVDNLDQATAAQRSVLLDDLARLFVQAGFDQRWLVQGICKSQAYQAQSERAADAQVGEPRPLKSLTSEQLFDSLEQALALPIGKADPTSARHNGLRQAMVVRLEETASRSPDEYASGIPQVLLLMNGDVTTQATSLSQSRTLRAIVEAPFLNVDEKLDALFLATLTRAPAASERQALRNHLDQRGVEEAYGEIFWALMNSAEFTLSR
jgi:hypothetical protein